MRTHLGISIMCASQKLCKEHVLEVDEARRIVDGFDEVRCCGAVLPSNTHIAYVPNGAMIS